MTTNNTSAYIALNRNRLRSYEKSVYLKDGSNFEIELFNGETVNVLAKIWINGHPISNSGLLLKPGQRFFLDRFIDSNNKFLFETYKVDATIETASAIANNGLIKVEFYKESQLTVPKWSTGIDWTWRPNFMYYGSGNPYTIPVSSVNNVSFVNTSSNTLNGLSGEISFTSSIDTENSVETGRVEKGDSSDQSFESTIGQYEYISFKTCEWKILPESTKPVEVSKIRNYCSECGTRIKKQTWKFCPSCGEKLD
jgi:hypothetical protein